MTTLVSDLTNKCNSTNALPRQDGNLKFVSHADLLRLAERNHCRGIATEPVLP
jgi:hypothetical protein